MTKIEFTIELLTKIRIWEQAEDTRMRSKSGRLAGRSTFTPLELQILFTLATIDPQGVHPKDLTIGRLGSFRKVNEKKQFERLEEIGYILKKMYGTVSRYFITDLGMKFVNTVMK